LVKGRLDRLDAGEDVDLPWSYKSLCVAFRGDAIKNELAPWRAVVVIGSYQAGLEALGRALQNFTKGRAAGRQVGFPRFRAKGRSHEAVIFQRPRITDSRHVELDRRLGRLRCKESLRKLTRLLASDPNARVMRSTVQRTSNGWVISFTVQRSAKQRQARKPNAVAAERRRAAPPGRSRSGWSPPSGASPSCTSAWRTCDASRPTNSRPPWCASSASSALRPSRSRT
jgi:hypothetical protein